MNKNIRYLSVALLATAFVFGLSACNTMSGLGKDTQKAGEKIEKEADRHTDDKGGRH